MLTVFAKLKSWWEWNGHTVLVIALLSCFVTSLGLSCVQNTKLEKLAKENENLRVKFEPYCVANGKNVGRMRYKDPNIRQMYIDIAYDFHCPALTIPLHTMGTHENIGSLFSHGAKKINKEDMIGTSPEEWQARAAARILMEEMGEFIFESKDPQITKAFWNFLGTRYCGWDPNWGSSNYSIWRAYKDLEKPKEVAKK
jgi:hypothetical protein